MIFIFLLHFFHFNQGFQRPFNANTLPQQATLARVSALLAAQREPKAAPAKKVRGKKAETFLG